MYIDYKVLGSRIKKYRISKDLTQQQLSELINKTPEYICKIEKGKATPSLEVLAAICHFLSADIGFILMSTASARVLP